MPLNILVGPLGAEKDQFITLRKILTAHERVFHKMLQILDFGTLWDAPAPKRSPRMIGGKWVQR